MVMVLKFKYFDIFEKFLKSLWHVTATLLEDVSIPTGYETWLGGSSDHAIHTASLLISVPYLQPGRGFLVSMACVHDRHPIYHDSGLDRGVVGHLISHTAVIQI